MESYINIRLEKEKALALLSYFGCQDIDDTIHVLEKYKIKGKPIRYESAKQHLFEEIFGQLCEEY